LGVGEARQRPILVLFSQLDHRIESMLLSHGPHIDGDAPSIEAVRSEPAGSIFVAAQTWRLALAPRLLNPPVGEPWLMESTSE
jgi:hypothetical protein